MRRKSHITHWLMAALLVTGTWTIAQTTGTQEQAPAAAQDQAPAPTQDQKPYDHKGHHRGMGGEDVDQRLGHMSRELNLTDDQKAKLKPVLEDEMKQMQAVRDDSSLSREQRRDKMMQIHQSTKPQVEAVLTPEQKDKLNKMHEEREQRWKNRKGGNSDQTPQQ